MPTRHHFHQASSLQVIVEQETRREQQAPAEQRKADEELDVGRNDAPAERGVRPLPFPRPEAPRHRRVRLRIDQRLVLREVPGMLGHAGRGKIGG